MGEVERITGHTHVVCLIGSPVAHSGSPATHNLSFETLGIDTAYLVFDVKPEALNHVIPAFKTMGGLDGCNVTMPCKRAVIPFLDDIDPAADLMQAVNVIKFTDGKAKGFNTDGVGFWSNVRKHGVEVQGTTVTIVGPGGAGSAVIVQAALDGAKKINVFGIQDATFESAKELIPRVIEKTGCDVTLHHCEDADDMKACIAASDILVNATNVGMGEGSTATAIPADFLASSLKAVADTIYFPRETQLILDAKAQGIKTVPGLGMMIEQAAAGEKIWYGDDVEMPSELIEQKIFS